MTIITPILPLLCSNNICNKPFLKNDKGKCNYWEKLLPIEKAYYKIKKPSSKQKQMYEKERKLIHQQCPSQPNCCHKLFHFNAVDGETKTELEQFLPFEPYMRYDFCVPINFCRKLSISSKRREMKEHFELFHPGYKYKDLNFMKRSRVGDVIENDSSTIVAEVVADIEENDDVNITTNQASLPNGMDVFTEELDVNDNEQESDLSYADITDVEYLKGILTQPKVKK
jgi:hypothetical protein